jgi:lysophospholipase L1-like esterase
MLSNIIKKSLKKIAELFLLVVVIPVMFFGVLELAVRALDVDTEVVKNDSFKIATPIWAANDFNFFAAEGLYRDILHNALPASAAEWMRYFEEARYVRYKMKPNISVQAVNTVNRIELEKGKKVLLESNSDGYRTADIPVEKPEGVYRVAVLGDSTAFGWGVEPGARYSQILEDKLNALGTDTKFEVMNFGIPGYTSYHGRAVFDHYAIKYSPDMVIFTFGANDGKMISQSAKNVLQDEGTLEDIKYVLWNLKTYKLLRKWILSQADPFKKKKAGSAKPEPKVPYATLQEYRGNLEYMADYCSANGMRPVFLGLCCPLDYLAKMSALGKSKGIPAFDGMRLLLKSIPAIKSGELYPDLALFYKQLYGMEVLKSRRLLWVTNDTCHPNRLGHQLIADLLFERLFPDHK